MKKTVCFLFLLFSAYAISAPASKPYTQNLVSCMIKNTTQKEKFTILHAAFTDAATTTKKPDDSSNLGFTNDEEVMAIIFGIYSKCPREAMSVQKYVPNGSGDAGKAFMFSIMLELINNPAVQEAFEKS